MSFTAQHLFFDDLDTTSAWKSPGRTVGEADIMTYAGFSGDFNPIHIDEEFAKTTPYRKRIVHGFGVFGIASGLGVQAPLVRIIAMTGVRWWKFALPVFIGDTIHVEARVVEKTVKGRGRRGEVVWYRGIVNQDGKTVQEGEIVMLVECRPLPRPDDGAAEMATGTEQV
jgi:3-hydroxybutyryl-CoA dehydratase